MMRFIILFLCTQLLSGCVMPTCLGPEKPFFKQEDLFVSGENGIANHRIPALVRTNKGSLIAACDARRDRAGDAPNNIDNVMRRSSDNGRTWTPLKVIVDYPGKVTAGDPSLTVDRQTGTIWLCYVYAAEGVGLAGGKSEPGYGDDTFHIYLHRSDDDGLTWSEPMDITRQIKQPKWRACWTAPGRGIQTRDGRLLICFSIHNAENRAESRVAISDDHGKSWHTSKMAGSGTNESQVAELDDGRILSVMRMNGNSRRMVAYSSDGGETWSPQKAHEQLVDPRGCQASILRYSCDDGTSLLLYSNPNNPTSREDMTVRISTDNGVSWPFAKQINKGYAAYSSLEQIKDGTIGLLYERNDEQGRQCVTFARFNMAWLLTPTPPPPPAKKASELSQKKASTFSHGYSAEEIMQGKDGWSIHTTEPKGEPFSVREGNLVYSTTEPNGTRWVSECTAWKSSVKDSFVYEVRLKVKDAAGPAHAKGVNIIARNGRHGGWLLIWDDGAAFGLPGGEMQLLTESVDNTNFHDWRLAWDGETGTGYVWRDGILLSETLESNDNAVGANFFMGDGSSRFESGSVEIQSIHFDLSGAYAPGK